MKKLLYVIPVIAILALLGGLIGSLFGNAAMGALIGGLLPIVWMVCVLCFFAAMFGSAQKFFDNVK